MHMSVSEHYVLPDKKIFSECHRTILPPPLTYDNLHDNDRASERR